MAALGLLSACTPATKPPVGAADAGRLVGHRTDVEPLVTPQSVDAWLRWQQTLASRGADAGAEVLVERAVREARAMREAGLDDAHVDAVEEVVAAVVTERTLASLTGGRALEAFRRELEALGPEQRQKAQAALETLRAGALDGGAASLEARFGGAAVAAVRAREDELAAAWEALLTR